MFENLLQNSPSFSSAKNSLISHLETAETNKMKTSIKILFNKSSSIKESSFGLLPSPRDNHSAIEHNGILFVFGGDRNKFSFNDLHAFILREN